MGYRIHSKVAACWLSLPTVIKITKIRIVALTIAAPALLRAQSGASLVGRVTDRQGGAIVGAAIEDRQIETGLVYSARTDAVGDYLLSGLPVGHFQLTVTAPGFAEKRIDSLETHVAIVYRQDVTLDVAAASASVQVESSTPLVSTEGAEIGQIVDASEILNLPLNGRDVYSLLALSPGAETAVSATSRNTNPQRPTLAGGRAGDTVFRLDGTDINGQNLPEASVTPSVDAVQEFRAITQLAPASESSTSTVDLDIRSGANQFHGTAYDFFRNNVLDAHPFFERDIVTPGFHTQPDQLRYNQFGAGLGGPIRRNRTFFYGLFEILRQQTLSQVTGTNPTAQMLAGNFTGVNPLSGASLQNFGPVIDPLSGQPFPGNTIPTGRFSQFAKAFLPIGFLPANCPVCQAEGLGFNFVGEAPAQNRYQQFLGRIDHRIDSNDNFFASFLIQPGNATSAASANPYSATNVPSASYFGSLNEIHTFSPTLVNQARLGYTRAGATLEPALSFNGAFSFSNTPTSLPSLVPTVDLAGYSILFGDASLPDRNFALDESWNAADHLTWLWRSHQFQAGFEFIRAHFFNTLNFGAFFIYADGLPASLGFSGSSFADFLLGTPLEGLTFQGTGKAPMVERSVTAGYLQDSWKPTPRLTLNYGLRYEFPQSWHDANTSLNRLSTLDTGPVSAALGGRFLLGGSPNYYLPGVGLVTGSGAPLIRGSLVDPDWKDFQPRAGLAWRPFLDNRTAIRAGAGIYYTIQDANSLAFEMLSPPFSFQNLFINLPPQVPLGQPLHDSQFWPAGSPTGVASEGDDPRNRDPRTYQWTASLEHEISNHVLVALEYLGNHGIDQPLSLLINQPALPTSSQLAQLEANPALNVTLATGRAPFPRIGLGYQYLENVGQSWYDALNVRASGQFGQRLHFTTVYTWSKALDMGSAEQELPGVTGNLLLGKSYSDYDHPQRFVSSWVYDLPSLNASRPLWRTLAGGWEVTGISTFEAGAPYSVTMGVDTSFTGAAATVYPDLTGPEIHENIRESNGIYLSPANFVAPPFGQFGELTRNQFHGPGIANFDLGFLKNIPIRERLSAQLRAELFNAFNHAQFQFAGSPLATSIGAPPSATSMPVIQYTAASNFGRATALPPRIVQMALKLIW